ncbi:TFIIS N-terminal domain-containing protein [Trichostrongylus colubriformis]|uniref:TFIIS N-terminal domain-containing protein n=1 Tax=Trichostrongylus colubriformis TaxID=6319 RepID=A0AAN8FLI6_TRICO
MDDDASSLNGQASPSVGDGSVSPFVGASPDYQEQGSSPGNDSAVASPSHASASVASSPAYKEQDDDSGDEFNADSPNVPGSPEADPITGNGDVTEAYEPTPSLPEGPLSSPTALSPQHGEDSHPKSPQQREEDGEDEKSPKEQDAISDDDEGEGTPKRPKSASSSDEGEGDVGTRKRRVIDSDDSDNEASSPKKNLLDSDDSDDELDEEQRKKKLGNLIVNIFGEDIDEDAEGGHDDDDEQDEKQQEEANQEDEDDYVRDRSKDDGRDRAGFEWDFDLMLREKKAERKKKRKRRDAGIDIINDDDGVIAHMVNAMKNAAKDDRHSNTERKPALKKRKMLHDVKMMLLRMDMLEAMIDGGMMSAVSEWLAPLPDKSLPALEIRTELLKILSGFGNLDQGVLKQSGLGRAVMLLYKHPRETKENKAMAAQIIREWSRPIFQVNTYLFSDPLISNIISKMLAELSLKLISVLYLVKKDFRETWNICLMSRKGE